MTHGGTVTGSAGATYTATHAENVPGDWATGDRAPNCMSASDDTPRDGESATGRIDTDSYDLATIEGFLDRQGQLICDCACSTDVNGLQGRVRGLRRAARQAQFTADVIEAVAETDGGEPTE